MIFLVCQDANRVHLHLSAEAAEVAARVFLRVAEIRISHAEATDLRTIGEAIRDAAARAAAHVAAHEPRA